jgi:small-conductance mechanosensitive channel
MIAELLGQLSYSLSSIGKGALAVIPSVLGALVVFVIGLIFAHALYRVVREIVRMVKLNELLSKAGVTEWFTRANVHFDAGKFLGSLAKIFIIAVFTVAALDILGLDKVTDYLASIVLGYLPQVIVAVLVLMVSVIVADIVAKIVTTGTQTVGVKASRFLGGVVKVSIWAFAIIVALSHLGIGAQYLYTLFTGFVVMLALAGGLAFGLGGKDVAGDLLRSVRDEIRKDLKHPHES